MAIILTNYPRNASLILFILLLPFLFIPYSTNDSSNEEKISLNNDIDEISLSRITFLFSYQLLEKNQLIHELNEFNPISIRFFKNFPIGLVIFDLKQTENLQKENPFLFSRLHKSERKSVVPLFEKLQLKGVNEAQQAPNTLPGDIIKAKELWNKGYTGQGVKLAIIDSGIDDQHPDFKGRIDFQISYVNTTFGFSGNEDYHDLNGHGTSVAGIAAGAGSIFTGIAYGARLYNFKVADESGFSTKASVIAAIDEAISQQVNVISISLGFDNPFPWSDEDELMLAVDKAVTQGISVVVSAGNEGEDRIVSTISNPATASEVITVGASNGSYNTMSFSSRGPGLNYRIDPDIVAPGYQVVGPLASGGVFQKALNALEGITVSDYIVLSGTSMAAPVVSGAITLLKQQFPEASPSTLRGAIQESAVELMKDESIYIHGSGLIDVFSASNKLENTKKGTEFELISSSPVANRSKILEFSNPLLFPGDTSQITMSFVTGTGGVIDWKISDSIRNFINFDFNPQIQSNSGYFERTLKASIPLHTSPGLYQGNFSYTFLGLTYYILMSFNIRAPKMKLYLDTYNTGRYDSSYFNYRDLHEFIAVNRSVDINDYYSTISWQNLSQSDILVLSDLEYPLSDQELEYIKDFHKNNGSILLLTSAFPYFNLYTYSRIVDIIGLTVDFNKRSDLISFVDRGRSREVVPLNNSFLGISWEQGDSLFNGVNYLPPLIGTGFTVDENNPTLIHQARLVSGYSIVAGFEPSKGGKVLILGSEVWFDSDYVKTASGKNFLANIFNWLQPNYELTVNAEISPNRELNIFSFIGTQNPLNVDVVFDNGTFISDLILSYNESIKQHDLKLNLGTIENQTIKIMIKNNSQILKSFEILDILNESLPKVSNIQIDAIISNNMPIPSNLEDTGSIIIADIGLNFSILHNESDSIVTQLLINSQQEKTLELLIPPLNTIKEYNVSTKLLTNGNNTHHFLEWSIPEIFSSGFYSYDIYVWDFLENDLNSSILISTKRGLLYIPDPEPILESRSLIGGRNIDYYRTINTFSGIPIWNPGSVINFNLYGRDINSIEFSVYIQFIHYYLWLFDRTVLDVFQILSSQGNKSENIGSFTVPDTSIPIPNSEGFNLEINNQVFVLLIFLRDNQGNYVIDAVFFRIGLSFFIDTNLFFILGMSLALLSLSAVVILIRRSSSRRSYNYQAYDINYQRTSYPDLNSRIPRKKTCLNCGMEVPITAMYCSSCGSYIEGEGD